MIGRLQSSMHIVQFRLSSNIVAPATSDAAPLPSASLLLSASKQAHLYPLSIFATGEKDSCRGRRGFCW